MRKYAIFKAEEFDAWHEAALNSSITSEPLPLPEEVVDSVVLRHQDVFASPALHCYANSISVAMKFLPIDHPTRHQMQELADFFHGEAVKADLHENKKIPD